jgi:hypothetical protein
MSRNKLVHFFPTLIVYTISVGIAYVVTGALHILSGRGIHGIFIPDHYVRWIGHYLCDVLPFFLASFVIVSCVFYFIVREKLHHFRTFALVGIISAISAVMLHLPFFPTSARGVLFVVTFGLIFVSVYCVVDGVLFGWPALRDRFRPFPFVPALAAGLLCGILVSAIYVGGFRLALWTGTVMDNESQWPGRAVPTPADTYQETPEAKAESRNAKRPYALSPPNVGLFTEEELPSLRLLATGDGNEVGEIQNFIDMDGNGFTDVVALSKGNIIIWLNRNGILERQKGSKPVLSPRQEGAHSLADFDGDGKFDIVFTRKLVAPESAFVHGFLRYLYWYPMGNPSADGQLYRQINLNHWENVSDTAFPDGLPWTHRKTEPIPWFDVNADGLLDFIWSGYPHPRASMSRLYVQKKPGVFIDATKQLMRWSPGRIYPEGSDAADYDNDGDMDFFAFGYLFRNDNGIYHQVCGDEMPGMACDTEGRTDEGFLFEDVNGDGALDFVLSYHGAEGIIPKFQLQLFLGDPKNPGRFSRVKEFERKFYGFNYLGRAVDFDFNGYQDILSTTPSRVITYHDTQWTDVLPAITGKPTQSHDPIGWIDLDEDGDWDLLAVRKSDSKTVLFRNAFNPKRYVKISAVGEGGVENQYGTTLHISTPGEKTTVYSYRLMIGIGRVSDPRLVYLMEPDRDYTIRACFTSLKNRPSNPATPPGVSVEVTNVDGRCVSYRFAVSPEVSRVDLKLVAGAEGALVGVR